MEIQQHAGAVVEAAVISAGLRQAPTREREVLRGERETPETWCGCPPSPPLYIGPLGGDGPRRSNLQGGRRPRGVACPPSQVGRPHP